MKPSTHLIMAVACLACGLFGYVLSWTFHGWTSFAYFAAASVNWICGCRSLSLWQRARRRLRNQGGSR